MKRVISVFLVFSFVLALLPCFSVQSDAASIQRQTNQSVVRTSPQVSTQEIAESMDSFDYEAFLESYNNLADTIDYTLCLAESYTSESSIATLNDSMQEITPSGYMVESLSNNTVFNAAYSAWLLATYSTNPSEIIEDELARETYYETIILKLIEAEYSQNTAIDWITQKGITNSLSIAKSFTAYAKQNDYEYILNNNDFSGLTEEQMQAVNIMAKNYIESQVYFKYLSKDLDCISKVLSYAKDIESLTENLAVYVQIGETMDSTIAFLSEMLEHCDNIYLANAIKRIILIYTDSFNGFVLKLAESGALLIGKNYVKSVMGSEWKNFLIAKLTSGMLSNGAVIINGYMIGIKLGQTISNIVFSTNKKLDKYEMMRCLTVLEGVLEQTLIADINGYDNSQASASVLAAGVDLLYSTYELDAQLYIEMAQIAESDWIGGISKAELSELIAVGDAKKAEYRAEYSSLSSYTGSCGTSAKYVLMNNGDLLIMGEGAINDYSLGKAPWFENCDKIKRIYVSSKITSVGKYAFYGLERVDYPIVLNSGVSICSGAFSAPLNQPRVIVQGDAKLAQGADVDFPLYVLGNLSTTGRIYFRHITTVCGNMSKNDELLIVENGGTLNIKGNLSISRSFWCDNGVSSGMSISDGGVLNVGGNVTSSGGYNEWTQSTFKVYGNANIGGSLTTGIRITFYVSGTVSVGGNLTLDTSPSGRGLIVLNGTEKQTINGTYYNLRIENTSDSGVEASGKVYIRGYIDNQAYKMVGKFILSGGYIKGPVFNGSLNAETANLKESVTVRGSLISDWGGRITITNNSNIVVEGNLTLSRFYLSDLSVLSVEEGTSLSVNGNILVTGWSGTGDQAIINIYGYLIANGNITVKNYGL